MDNGSSPEMGGENPYCANEPGEPSYSVKISTDERVASPPILGGYPPCSPELVSMLDRVKKRSHIHEESNIYRVPNQLRELNKDAYTPRIVSIGPIHFGKENLKPMEVHKTRYMKLIFKRTAWDEQLTLFECGRAIMSMEKKAESCYEHDCPTSFGEDRRLADVLLVDGCFLLELLLRWSFPDHSTEIRDDPIFGAAMVCSLQRDLALLENQIPFFVLQRLYELIKGSCRDNEPLKNQIPLNELCASFFYLKLNSYHFNYSPMHLLDIIRLCYLPTRPLDSRTTGEPKKSRGLINCVTKLRESKIKFVTSSSESLFDFSFSLQGVLKIPKLYINDTIDSLLRNMIAFEQCCRGISYYITSYAILMDCLIDSTGDVEFLEQRRIIQNYYGHPEGVSNIFNKISKEVFVDEFFFDPLCEQIKNYENVYGSLSFWARARESFKRDYCSSPWKFIGVVAGSVLLILTLFQTGYTIASYYNKPNN